VGKAASSRAHAARGPWPPASARDPTFRGGHGPPYVGRHGACHFV